MTSIARGLPKIPSGASNATFRAASSIPGSASLNEVSMSGCPPTRVVERVEEKDSMLLRGKRRGSEDRSQHRDQGAIPAIRAVDFIVWLFLLLRCFFCFFLTPSSSRSGHRGA